MKIKTGTGRIILSALAVCVIVACSKNSDEEQIRLTIEKLSKAVEENKPTAIAEYLHEDFRANHGNLDAQQLKQFLMMQGLRQQAVSITIVSSKTMIDPVYTDKAQSTLSVITTVSAGGLLPSDGSVRVVNLEWRKDRDWKILKADWEQ